MVSAAEQQDLGHAEQPKGQMSSLLHVEVCEGLEVQRSIRAVGGTPTLT